LPHVARYLRRLEERMPDATEHTHRAAFQEFLETLAPGVSAINEPRRAACGAPDFAVTRRPGPFTVGYVETKDVGRSLDEAEKTDQVLRYLRYLPNFVLTDYLEFRWYVDGEERKRATLARLQRAGRLAVDAAGQHEVVTLLQGFLAHRPEPIRRARDLAGRMAGLTHLIRDVVVEAFAKDAASPMLIDLRAALAKGLLPDLEQAEGAASFADMYAQTLAYGLFAARVRHTEELPFTRLGAAREIPSTNPLLRQLFEMMTGTVLDGESYAGFVEDLVQVLAAADLESILRDFGVRTGREDPVVHFYETFLATYDRKLREQRGVYYTPEPVVSYIVRSVDYLLRERFGLTEGLADTRCRQSVDGKPSDPRSAESDTEHQVLILDPACGTGTFLYMVVDLIRDAFIRQGQAGRWSDYVRRHLLPRIFGFEILMAPYAVAHFKLGMQLAGLDLTPEQRRTWTFDFAGAERLGIYLTNTLEAAEHRAETLLGPLRVISEEAAEADRIKRDLPILVIMGNPPYSNFGRMNSGSWIMELMADWKPTGERKWNPDDFMKFMRWAQWRIDRTGAGILAFITNSTYLDGLTHRRMRESLLRSFNEVYVLDLHGGSLRQGGRSHADDENVFDIRPGVAIGIFVKQPGAAQKGVVHHAELWGPRSRKYEVLSSTDVGQTPWTRLEGIEEATCLGQSYFLVPKRQLHTNEYCRGISLTDIFPQHQNGLKTDRDSLFFDFDRDALSNRMKTFYSDRGLTPPFVEQHRVQNSSSYPLLERRARTQFDESALRRCLYRPFDRRWLYYSRDLTSRPAWDVMRYLLGGGNCALLACRQQAEPGFAHVFCADSLVECCAVSDRTREITTVFPLYLYPEGNLFANGTCRHVNIGPDVLRQIEEKTGLVYQAESGGDRRRAFGPEDVFAYVYAVLHSPKYRSRFADYLAVDFPRIPLTAEAEIFRRLSALGERLRRLHLDPAPEDAEGRLRIRYPVPGENQVEASYPQYVSAGSVPLGASRPLRHGRVYINERQYFEGVSPAMWEFRIGAFRVCEKYLKDRRERILSEELEHYPRVTAAVAGTIGLMRSVDRVIHRWPLR
jgi:hypothetical protein